MGGGKIVQGSGESLDIRSKPEVHIKGDLGRSAYSGSTMKEILKVAIRKWGGKNRCSIS